MKYQDTIMFREIGEQPTVLEGLVKTNHEVLAKIAERVKKGEIDNISIGARGSSLHASMYFAHLVEIFTTLPVKFLSPSVFTSYGGKLEIKRSLVIGVSQSGKAADVLECLRHAKKDGSITVAVTNHLDSPLAKEADYHLYLNAQKEVSVAATKTVTAQMYVLLLLAQSLCADPLLINAPQMIVSGIQSVLKNAGNIADYAKKFVDTKDMFVLARGLNKSVALESGLKLSETTYIKALAYSVSDFWHGPYAMIDKNATVIAYAPKGQSQKDVLEMVQKCKGDGAKVTVIGTKDCTPDIVIPEGTDIETPFYNLVTMQILACALSTHKGISVDTPRGLNKVTITK
ncbi:MAG: SIS domain-containing protein [Firmicutes bacterium]|nr:SIS domain-containing protein [Bacillota bacterium]